MSKEDENKNKELAKKAYDKGFATQVLVSGKDGDEAKRLYKTASQIGERNRAIRESVMDMIEETKGGKK